jgi:hypothetical protein
MESVQRYECWPENPAIGVDGKMFPDRCGKWMLFADHKALLDWMAKNLTPEQIKSATEAMAAARGAVVA